MAGRCGGRAVWFCPACGRDFRPRKAETEENVFPIGAEHLEYLKKKAEEMQGTVEEALDRVINDCYWADKEKEQKAREDTTVKQAPNFYRKMRRAAWHGG